MFAVALSQGQRQPLVVEQLLNSRGLGMSASALKRIRSLALFAALAAALLKVVPTAPATIIIGTSGTR